MTTELALATLHLELATSKRIDIHFGVAVAAASILYSLNYEISVLSALAMLLAVLLSIGVCLSPLYSPYAYRRLRLSAPCQNPTEATIVLAEIGGKLHSHPLTFRESDGAKLIPRFEHERVYFENTSPGKMGQFEFERVSCPINLPIRRYITRVNERDTQNAAKLIAYYGENKFDIPLPEVWKLVLEQAQSPFFLFQMFCVLLWTLDEYWYFAVFTLFMLVMFEFVVAQNRRKNNEVARLMLRPAHPVWVKRAGSWRNVLSSQIVPLDIVGITKDAVTPLPCDLLLVHGACVVNEAMLTGESTPKMKDSVCSDQDVNLDEPISMPIEESRFVLLGGTFIFDARPDAESLSDDAPPDIMAIGVAIRTGYETTQGSLMRVILHAGERVTVDSNREAYAFMFCLVVIACIAAGYVLMEGLKDPDRSQWKLFLHCIMIVTSVVPPELPMELSLAVTTSLSNLIQKHSVYCTEPYRIPYAGKIDVCCFDKTGTLTSDDLRVRMVVDTHLNDVSEDVKEIIALCQSMVVLHGQVAGDTTETAAWRHLEDSFMAIPSSKGNITLDRLMSKDGNEYNVVKKLPFDSSLRRMTVIVRKNSDSDRLVLTKGAPEALQPLLRQVPENYQATYTQLAERGLRVLCLARTSASADVIKQTRSQIESNLEFQGFLALDSPLKVDATKVVKELKEAGHRVIIITGDSASTAMEVGRQVGISDGTTMVGTDLTELEQSRLSQPEVTSQLLQVSVFARVSPAQKESVISHLSKAGKVTLMCGDGTNDAGALKSADVGVSVISHPQLEQAEREGANKNSSVENLIKSQTVHIQLGDASIASPFTAKSPRVSTVLDIVRQGRCTLVTTIQMFKILAVNGMLHSIIMTALFLRGVRQGDFQSTLYGFLVAVVFALLSFTQSENELTARRPVSRIFSWPVIVSIAGQSIIHVIALFSITGLVVPEQKIDPDAEFQPNLINTIVYISGFTLQANVFAVNYRGYPFMTGFFENKRFSRVIFFMWTVSYVLALGLAPNFLLSILELVELPQSIQSSLCSLLALDTALTFAWELFIVRGILGG